MKFQFLSIPSKINHQHIQFLLALLALIALVLGAGAPVDIGGVGG